MSLEKERATITVAIKAAQKRDSQAAITAFMKASKMSGCGWCVDKLMRAARAVAHGEYETAAQVGKDLIRLFELNDPLTKHLDRAEKGSFAKISRYTLPTDFPRLPKHLKRIPPLSIPRFRPMNIVRAVKHDPRLLLAPHILLPTAIEEGE